MNGHWTLTGRLADGERLSSVQLRNMPFRIGRRSDLELCLARRSISSRHAELVVSEGRLLLRDLTSTNGTYVNGHRILDQVEVQSNDLIQFADMPFRLGIEAAQSDSRTIQEDVCDRALGLVQFDKLINERAIVSYFQPIVDLRTNGTIAYEILSRSRLVGLETPAAMFQTAAELNMEHELSRLMRIEGVRTSAMFPEPPHVFVNTHPVELASGGFLEMMTALRRLAISQPITVEIHESAVTDVGTMKDIQVGLSELNMELAFDDFGSGQARLIELAEIRPKYLKFDRQMIHAIHQSSYDRQHMLENLVRLVNELGVIPLAEGVECAEEGTLCGELGFALAQGFYYGMPAPVAAYMSAGVTCVLSS
jgi:EAL domain-containing protein (putative c-di-GMP-specific phosphodiesterase class I)